MVKSKSRHICREGDLFSAADFGDVKPVVSDGLKADDEAGGWLHQDFTRLFDRLAKSAFRSRFRLREEDIAYIRDKGLTVISRHAEELIARRLAPAVIPNDGKQTPMRGHPVFIAQHATGCCCRGCLCKWHGIEPGRELTPQEQSYVVEVIMAWIRRQLG